MKFVVILLRRSLFNKMLNINYNVEFPYEYCFSEWIIRSELLLSAHKVPLLNIFYMMTEINHCITSRLSMHNVFFIFKWLIAREVCGCQTKHLAVFIPILYLLVSKYEEINFAFHHCECKKNNIKKKIFKKRS